jgi:hypothetical protein
VKVSIAIKSDWQRREQLLWKIAFERMWLLLLKRARWEKFGAHPVWYDGQARRRDARASMADEMIALQDMSSSWPRRWRMPLKGAPCSRAHYSAETLTTWWGSPFEKALARLEAEPRQRLLEEVRRAVHQFEEPQGFMAPAELLLGVGMKEREVDL